MRILRFFTFIYFLVLSCLVLKSQDSLLHSSKYIEASLMYGSLFKHSPAFRPKVTQFSQGFNINYHVRTSRGNKFFQKFNYPSIGGGVYYLHYGDNNVFGDAVSIYSALNFFLMERKRIRLELTLGLGMGFLTKQYDRIENFDNNVIGSNLNLNPSINFSANYDLNNFIYIKASGGIVHYSNGHIALPNLGTNFLNANLGLGYKISDKFKKSNFVKVKNSVKQFKNEVTLCPGLSDRGTLDANVILPTYSIHYHRVFYTSEFNALKIGLSAEYKNNDYDYKLYEVKDNTDIAIAISDEIFFGRVSMNLQVGVYVYSYYQSTKFGYQRLGINYRIPVNSDKFGLSVGAHLKTHYAAAELTEAKIAFLF